MNAVEQIKDKADIAEFIGSYITLARAGTNLKGKCPFHNEKTASFFVSPERQSFYCFGCGVGGDIFSFVEKYEGHDFKGALKLLAERYNVTLDNDFSKEEKSDKDELYRVLTSSAEFFKKELHKNTDAIKYLKDRGLKDETIEKFQIGFAPSSWSALKEHLISLGYSEEIARKAGLLKEKEGRHYDTFRSRIVFPIFDSVGRVIGFSGRIFGEESEAKYLNSPETPLFRKGEILYGFNFAKKEIRDKGYTILVEGQFDLVMSQQEGFLNTVASSGTSFGEKGLEVIGRLSKNLMLVFDSDKAGIIASGRVAKLALPRGFNVKTAHLPKGSDPAEALQQDVKIFKEAIKHGVHIIDFYLGLLEKAGYDERKFSLEVSRIVLPYVALVDNKMEQAYFVRKIADKTHTPESSVWAEIAKIERAPTLSRLVEEARATEKNNLPVLLSQICLYADKKSLKDLSQNIRSKYEAVIGNPLPVIEEGKESKLLFEMEIMLENSELEALAQEILTRLEKENLEKELQRITEKLKQAESGGNEEEVGAQMKNFQETAKKLEALKNDS